MANHVKIDASDVTPGIQPTNDPKHDVTGQRKHLQSTTGEKGASVAQELMELAEKSHDSEGAFSNTKYAPNDTPTFKKGEK